MRKTLATIAAVVGVAFSGASLANDTAKMEGTKVAKAPVKMDDKQMDQVTAGALVNVQVLAIDVLDVNNVLNNNMVEVNVPVNAAVAVGVLGTAASNALQNIRR